MDSSYFGEPNLGNERSSASSSRKGKKNNSDKPKQPQRGLGVAQLEKIRLHSQMACGYHPSLHGPYPSTFANVNLHFLLLKSLIFTKTILSFFNSFTFPFTQEDPRVQIPYSSVPSSSFSYSSSPTSSYAASYGFQPNIMVGVIFAFLKYQLVLNFYFKGYNFTYLTLILSFLCG